MNSRSWLDKERLIAHTRAVRELDELAERTIFEYVALAIERFAGGWVNHFNKESKRLMRTQDHVERALATLMADRTVFDPRVRESFDVQTFQDEVLAFDWIGDDSNHCGPAKDYFLFVKNSDWSVAVLWNVREHTRSLLSDLITANEERVTKHWTQPPETTSRLPYEEQRMIHDLCQVWHDLVDDRLGLPRRNSEPSNPLLRYLDFCLGIPLGDTRPKPKSVLQLVYKYIRPNILAQARI